MKNNNKKNTKSKLIEITCFHSYYHLTIGFARYKHHQYIESGHRFIYIPFSESTQNSKTFAFV